MGSTGKSKSYTDSLDYKDFQKKNFDRLKTIIDNGGSIDDVKDEWYKTRLDAERKNIKEMNLSDAVDLVRESISTNILDGWFRNADSDYKPKLMDSILSNKGVLNAGLVIAYNNYLSTTNNPMPFEKWLNTPQTLYRGTKGQSTVQSDIFMSYTPDKSVAEKFGGNISTIKIKPIDTLGSYQTTGEQEFLIPVKRKRKK